MLTARRIHTPATARRWFAAAAASAAIAACGAGIVTGDRPDASRSPSIDPITNEARGTNCPKPRCWWTPTPSPRRAER